MSPDRLHAAEDSFAARGMRLLAIASDTLPERFANLERRETTGVTFEASRFDYSRRCAASSPAALGSQALGSGYRRRIRGCCEMRSARAPRRRRAQRVRR
jgi:hypothetical protein